MKVLQLLTVFAALGVMVGGVGGQTSPAARQLAAEPQLAILDTDIGDDIDDAFALALALRSPELKLLGVVTAYGDTEMRARLVDRYLGAVGRSDIPVAAGVTTAHQYNLTQAAYARQSPERKHADGVEFLLGQIREHPGQITLIAIGPLTNVGAAIERDPATFRQLKRVVLMGGSVYRGYNDWKTGAQQPPSSEWNIRCDPAGLRALLAVGVPVFMMPLDSTQIRLKTKERETIYSHGSPLTDQLTLLYHEWMGGNPDHPGVPTLFDPVAVTYAFRPELCPATPIRLEVDDKGFTRPVEGAPNAQVCLKSDEKGFLELLVGRITADSGR
jgi:inosine-uridine nucleoside N-ribohydrolase